MTYICNVIIKQLEIMTATYNNTQLNETYKISGVKDLEQAWKLSSFVSNRNNWNHDCFATDVKVTIA